MRTLATKARAINQYNGLGNQLWDLAGNRPSLDLRFADDKSLVDATTGTNLVDHTRASSGTYVGSDGLIKTATTNLLLRSEEFDNAGWAVKTNLSVSANAVIAPNGTLTADKLVEDSSNAEHFIPQTVSGLNLSNVHTFSVYLKSAERLYARVRLGASGNFVDVVVNLLTGTLATPRTGGTGSAPIANATSVGDDWFRVSISGTNIGGSGSLVARVDIHNGTTTSYQGDGTSGIYIWGAQLEQSSTVGEYVKTTSTINSAPRFDHNPTTGESLGLLVEESRINRFEWSNSAVQGETWNNVGLTFDLQTGATDPAGGTNGIIASDATNTNTGSFLQRTSIDATLPANTVVTYSVWVKPISTPNDVIILNLFANGVTDTIAATFDNTGGVLSLKSTSASGTGVVTSASPIPHPNGWYRLVLTGIPSTTVGSDMRARINLTTYEQVQGTPRFYWYGAQLEVGSFPTSYIKTEGATVTRAADVASISGSNFSSWYRQDEGTVFAEFRDSPGTQAEYPFAISDNTVSNRFTLFASGSSTIKSRLISAGNVFNPSDVSFATSSLIQACIAGKVGTDQAITACNGILSSAGSPTSMPAVNRMYVGAAHDGTEQTNGTIRRLTYWPTRLANETLQTITN